MGQIRDYPFADSMAHVLGYVAAVAERDLTGDPLLELPGFRVGKNGIEQKYDLALRGSAGTSQIEVNAYGRVIRELHREGSEEHTSELQSLMRISYAVFCLKKKKIHNKKQTTNT